MKTVLLIDEQRGVADAIEFILADQGYKVITKSEGQSFSEMTELNPDIVLLNIKLDVNIESKTLTDFRDSDEAKVPLIVIADESEARNLSKQFNPDEVLIKPFDLADLTKAVAKYLS